MSRRRFLRPWTALAALVISAAGCRADSRAEAERLSRAVELVREASRDDKATAISTLRDFQCREHCSLARVCRKGYSLHVEALRLIDGARLDTDQDEPGRQAASAQLLRAETSLQEARRSIGLCHERLYKLVGLGS